jgi:hypothetical protein
MAVNVQKTHQLSAPIDTHTRKLANDAVGAAEQGRSVTLSADGNTAIVGGYVDNSGTGAAWVYTRTSGVWTQQGSKRVR